jgi:hypothetical protein
MWYCRTILKISAETKRIATIMAVMAGMLRDMLEMRGRVEQVLWYEARRVRWYQSARLRLYMWTWHTYTKPLRQTQKTISHPKSNKSVDYAQCCINSIWFNRVVYVGKVH